VTSSEKLIVAGSVRGGTTNVAVAVFALVSEAEGPLACAQRKLSIEPSGSLLPEPRNSTVCVEYARVVDACAPLIGGRLGGGGGLPPPPPPPQPARNMANTGAVHLLALVWESSAVGLSIGASRIARASHIRHQELEVVALTRIGARVVLLSLLRA
jgi:hypothetical protein